MEYLKNSRKYLDNFVKGKYKDYVEARKEYRPAKGYGNFPNSNSIVQCMYEITMNFEDVYSDLRIPERFATPQALIDNVKWFVKILKRYNGIFKKTLKSYKDPDAIPVPITEINNIRLETIDAFEHFIALSKGEMKQGAFDNDAILNIEKITIGRLFYLFKRLSLGSLSSVISLIVTIVGIAIFGTKSANNMTNEKLTTTIESQKSQIDSVNMTNELIVQQNDSLFKIVRTLSKATAADSNKVK